MPDAEMYFTKSLEGFEIKDADRGEVQAIVSTLNIVDRDGDVVLNGAIPDGTTVKLSAYAHDVIREGKAPVGRGTIRIKGDRAILEGQYFMSTQRGREAFAQVKEMGNDSEWSVGFPKNVKTVAMTEAWHGKGARRLIAGMRPIEASPVFIGANQFTSTLGVKESGAEDQADGFVAIPDPTPEEATASEIKAIGEKVATKVAETILAERKADIAAAAEATRKELETKAANDAAVESARKASEAVAISNEFERFMRTSLLNP